MPSIEAWHDFFLLTGTAASTLIGAMFVVVSIGSGVLTANRAASIRTFLTSTVTHLAAALFGSGLMVMPVLDWTWRGALMTAAGAAALHGDPWTLELFALALALLVAAGIRNAWDMIVFLITRPRG